MISERQLWAKKRNWLLYRLGGALSTLSYDNKELISQLVGPKDAERPYAIESDLRYLIKEISKSKYKERRYDK